MSEKPNCYECKYRNEIPGDCHSTCQNDQAKVTGNKHGIRNGWFLWPWNFDPIWLESCDGFISNASALAEGTPDSQKQVVGDSL